MTDAVASWVTKGFVRGPVNLDQVPEEAKVNGIMCRPKPDGSVRIILNMSAPAGRSVNDGIDISRFPAKMSSTTKWLAVLEKAGRGCYIMKIDWSDAYKHIPVRAEDLNLQWFEWLGKAFQELCLIFGTASSVGLYDQVAKLVLEIVLAISKFPHDWVCQHLDDVCAAAPAGSEALQAFGNIYRKVAEQVGVKLAPTTDPDKAFSACKRGTVLGVYYDTESWTWQIPSEKLARLVTAIKAAMEEGHVTQQEMWSLCGKIIHYAPLIPEGRFNLDQLIKANSESKEKKHMVVITESLRRQLSFWWLMLQTCAEGVSIPSPKLNFPPWTREVYTDAAGGSLEGVGRGCGVVSEEWWAYIPWPRKINCGMKAEDGKKLSRKLSALELVGPLVAVAAGHDWCRGKWTRVWVDNSGSVGIWKKGYSTSCPLSNTLEKAIATVAAGIGCRFTIEKVRRRTTAGAVLADDLSKADFNQFWRKAGPVNLNPAPIPKCILAWLADPVSDEELGSRTLMEIKQTGHVLEPII